MKNILVTGGAGFIGSHTVVELLSSGYRAIILDNFSNSEKSVIGNLQKITGQKVTVYEGSYQDKTLLEKIQQQHKIGGVIHFAAYKAVGESVSQPLKYYDNNVAGLIVLLGFMTVHKINNLVFSSSCTVYGQPDKLPITEQAPQKAANSPYGATKQMCETIIHDATVANKDLKVISLRYFNPIGAHKSGLIGELPKGTPSNLVPFLTQAVAGLRDKLVVFGDDYSTPDGTCIRDYIHVVDLAKAHVKALPKLEAAGENYYDVFNVGTGHGSSVLEIIKTFEQATGQKVPYKIGPRRAGDVVNVYASVDKIQKQLDWQAKESLEQSLKDAWRWQETLAKS